MTSVPQDGAFDVGIVTINERSMREFYEDVLCFEYHATIPIGQDTLIKFRYGRSYLKLYIPAASPTRPLSAGDWSSRIGIRYLTVPVDDLQDTINKCHAKGAAVNSEIFELPGDRFAAFIEDPDGNAIELFQNTARVSFPEVERVE